MVKHRWRIRGCPALTESPVSDGRIRARKKAGHTPHREMYKWRHQIENLFAKLKEFRAVATRYDKTDASFAAAIHLMAGVVAAT